MENFIAVLKHKHNSYRRDNSTNASFIINCNLNRELDVYSNNSSTNYNNASTENLEQTI